MKSVNRDLKKYLDLRSHYYSLMKTAGTTSDIDGGYLSKAKTLVPKLNHLEKRLTSLGIDLVN